MLRRIQRKLRGESERIAEPRSIKLAADFEAPPALHAPDASHVLKCAAAESITILGQQVLMGEKPDWKLGPQKQDRLGTVTLHYHEWAWQLAKVSIDESLDGELRSQALYNMLRWLSDWINQCSLAQNGSRALAWNAYAIATRIGWWTRLHALLPANAWHEFADLEQRFLRSLWQQAAFLERNLEWDLRGNHLLRDAVGLAHAGRFFEGDEPARWLALATKLGLAQVREQVMADGGHFERSPMYHLHMMEDILALIHLLRDEAVVEELRSTWLRMADCLRWLRHPDGEIALLNDAAFNGAIHPEMMLTSAGAKLGSQLEQSQPSGGRHFDVWGLAVWHGEPWSVFFDVGPIGPDYQPGHAHADTLSIECSYRGQRLFVDPGTYAYDLDATRAYDRSTAAHNTVCIDDEDSSEVWHIFRVGRRARVSDVQINFDDEGMTAQATHDGYRFLQGKPRHTRRVSISNDASQPLTLHDFVAGRGDHTVSGSLLLDPAWRVESHDASGWMVNCGQHRLRIQIQSSAPLALRAAPAAYHPRFGVELATTRLTWRHHGPLPLEVTTIVST